MVKNYDFDYIIIGSGPAGRTVATELAKAKKKVAIVECGDFGGAEIATRDLPYQLSLDFANTYHKFTSSPAVNKNSCHFNFPTLLTNTDVAIASTQKQRILALEKLGVKLIKGFAHFIDNTTIAIDEHKLTAKFFVLATGSVLKASEISGLDQVKFLEPDTAFRVRRLPKFVFVIGGGPTGVEIAEYYASLGTGVIIMERGTHILPREDDEVAEVVDNYLKNQLGVTIITNAKVTAITEDYTSKIVVFTNGSSEKMVRVDTIALATGSEPFLDYSLENAGVDYNRNGIIVDKYFNTTARNIFAIGDCINDKDSSTERSCVEARTLVQNLLHRQKTTANYSSIPRLINTFPAVAVLGLNERDLVSRDLKYHKQITYLRDIPSLAYSDSAMLGGFIKILTDNKKRFLGATIVAENTALALELKNLLLK